MVVYIVYSILFIIDINMNKYFTAILLALTATTSFANQNAINIVKSTIKSTLKDPESAIFKDVKIVTNSEGEKSICGSYNAKNSYGGYTGFQSFYAKSNDKIVYLNDDVNYQLAGCEGKTNELKAKELQKEKLLKEKEEYVNKRVNNICHLQNQFIDDVIYNRKKIDIAYNRAKQWFNLDSSLLKNFENEEYSSSQLKDDYLEALNKLQADPIKVKILRGNDYTARAKIMLDIKNSCIEKYTLFFN